MNHIIKFVDDTTVVGLISKGDESAYKEEVNRLVDWCKVNKLSLNVDKIKELVVDFRSHTNHSLLNIDGSSVEIVKSTKFLGVHLTENLTWSLNTSSIAKKAQQRLYFLRRHILQRDCREHSEHLHHYLVWELHHHRSQDHAADRKDS